MISNEMFGSDIIRVKIRGYLKNINENETFEIDEKGIRNKNKIMYSYDNVKYTIKIDDKKVLLIRENDDFLNSFVFDMKKSTSNYLLKENGYDVDIDIVTSDIEIRDNYLCIMYKVIDSDTCYEFKLEMSDIL